MVSDFFVCLQQKDLITFKISESLVLCLSVFIGVKICIGIDTTAEEKNLTVFV